MIKSQHLSKRLAERNIDMLCISILHIYGVKENNRNGLYLSKNMYKDIKSSVLNLHHDINEERGLI